MKNLFAVVVLAIGGFIAIVSDVTPAPPAIKIELPTEESIKAQVRQEQLQKRYDAATVIATHVYRSHHCNPEFASLTGQMAVDFRLPVRLVAATVIVESTCNPGAMYKHPHSTDVGLMQVNTRVWHHSVQELMDPRLNMKIGSRILASYVHSYGLVEGLHHYNGLGNPTNSYAEHVLKVAGIGA